MSLEPQALNHFTPVSSYRVSLFKVDSYSTMAAGALAIVSTLQIRRKEKGKMAEKIPCQVRSAVFKQPTWKSHTTVLLMAQPK